MSLSHLYPSVVECHQLLMTSTNGRASLTWVALPAPLNYVHCRLDLNFLRPGKDQPMAANVGVTPDRIGVMFADVDSGLTAGMRITAVPNDEGRIPVVGTFEIRVVPDVAQDYSEGHHQEIQIVEVANTVAAAMFPGAVT